MELNVVSRENKEGHFEEEIGLSPEDVSSHKGINLNLEFPGSPWLAWFIWTQNTPLCQYSALYLVSFQECLEMSLSQIWEAKSMVFYICFNLWNRLSPYWSVLYSSTISIGHMRMCKVDVAVSAAPLHR